MGRKFIVAIICLLCCIGCSKEEEEPTIFSDDFEDYSAGEYPSSGGWYVLWSGTGSGDTYVVSGIASSGNKSFMLSGYPNWTRTDGVEISLTDVYKLTYEIAVMIPSNSATGGYVGFFVRTSPNESKNYNGIWFNSADSLIYVKGISTTNTGYTWERDSWYSVKIELDYDSLMMNVWVNNENLASGIEAAPRDTSNIFSISTEWRPISGQSINYYDDIEIYETP